MVQYFAKGGGCFLADTMIQGVNQGIRVQDIKSGDRVLSFNEITGKNEVSQVSSLDVLKARGVYTLNDNVKVTGEHPFYVKVKDTLEVRLVKDLKLSDKLVGVDGDTIDLETIDFSDGEEVTVYNLINVRPNNNYYANGYLVHNKGGGGHASSSHASSSRSSSTSSRSTSKSSSTSSKSTASKPAPVSAQKTSTKPGTAIKSADGKSTVKSSLVKPANKTFSSEKGIVGANGYTPRFTSGYHAPYGSVVYYRDTSFVDYLPWIYIFGHSNAAPANQQATIVQPDGKQVVAKPEAGGTDGMLILNWIILIIIVGAIVAGIVYLVNKFTQPKTKNAY